MLHIKVAPKVDGNPADPPPFPVTDGQVGPSGSPGTAVTERVEENSGEHEPAHRKQEDASECRGDQNASATFAVDGPIEEGGGGGGDPRDDPVPRLVERENDLWRGTTDRQISFNICYLYSRFVLGLSVNTGRVA
ncbi:hypothetical protein FRC04_004984 [Tulasnella sp. 424]|nr:hypothetical protein FRC04_004984 [Tulasnella sp. 424]